MPGICLFKSVTMVGSTLASWNYFIELRNTDSVVTGYAEIHINSQLENRVQRAKKERPGGEKKGNRKRKTSIKKVYYHIKAN